MENSIYLSIAQNAIKDFIQDWQKEPGRWFREVEIQAAIYSRINSVYEEQGIAKINAVYEEYKDLLKDNQIWNRISLEPEIRYIWEDRKKYFCYPDIVIWDDITNSQNPPDQEKGKNWPMELVFEIKTNYNLVKNKKSWNDIEKMKWIIKNNNAKYGLWLNFNLDNKPVKKNENIENSVFSINTNLLIYEIYLDGIIVTKEKVEHSK